MFVTVLTNITTIGMETRRKACSPYSCKGRRTCLRRCFKEDLFLVRDQTLRSSLQYGDQTIAGQLEKHVLKPMLAILKTYMETRLKWLTQIFVVCSIFHKGEINEVRIKVSSQSRKFEFNVFSIIHLNKVFQTAQAINNILKSHTKW